MKLEPAPEYRRRIVGWKVWYSDGSVYSSRDSKWEDLPKYGIITLKKFFIPYNEDKPIVEIQSNSDYYCPDDSFVTEKDLINIKAGHYVSNEVYQKIRRQAVEDQEIING